MSRRVQVLFLLALLGVLTCIGLALLAYVGGLAAGVYAGMTLVLLAVAARRARAAQEAARRDAGRTCTCCTTSQHDPVKVV